MSSPILEDIQIPLEGTGVILTFNETVALTQNASFEDVTIYIDSTPVVVTGININETSVSPYGTSEVTFTGEWMILEGSTVSVNYASSSQSLADTDGNFVDLSLIHI